MGAMVIVSSVIVEQLDLGHMWFIRENHTDNIGKVHEWIYHPGKSVDLNAKLAEHATAVNDRLVAQEIEVILNG